MLREIVAAEPRNGDAHLLLGTALAIKGFPNESTLHLKEAVRLIPDSAPAHNTLGMALSRFGDLEGARKEFEQAIRLDDKLAQAHINLALVLAQAGKAAKAGTHLNRAIAVLGDTRAAAYPRYLLARLWIEQNEIGKGARELEKAVQLRPDYAEAWSELGRLRRYLFDGPGARAALEKAVALNPRDTTAQYRLGLIYLKNGRAHDAIGHFREALREDPGDRSTLYNLMRALRDDGQTEEAEGIRVQLAASFRKSAAASQAAMAAGRLNNEGIKLENAGNLAGALLKYRSALDLDPTQSVFHLNCGLVLCQLGRFEEGIAEIREALELEPGNVKATKALYVALERQQRAMMKK